MITNPVNKMMNDVQELIDNNQELEYVLEEITHANDLDEAVKLAREAKLKFCQ